MTKDEFVGWLRGMKEAGAASIDIDRLIEEAAKLSEPPPLRPFQPPPFPFPGAFNPAPIRWIEPTIVPYRDPTTGDPYPGFPTVWCGIGDLATS